jgi:hypothetical protein
MSVLWFRIRIKKLEIMFYSYVFSQCCGSELIFFYSDPQIIFFGYGFLY